MEVQLRRTNAYKELRGGLLNDVSGVESPRSVEGVDTPLSGLGGASAAAVDEKVVGMRVGADSLRAAGVGQNAWRATGPGEVPQSSASF